MHGTGSSEAPGVTGSSGRASRDLEVVQPRDPLELLSLDEHEDDLDFEFGTHNPSVDGTHCPVHWPACTFCAGEFFYAVTWQGIGL